MIETDGSIYNDRGYTMVNITTIIEPLTCDLIHMIRLLGYSPTLSRSKEKCSTKYVVRVTKKSEDFLAAISLVNKK